MVLVDTSVWIDHLRNDNQTLSWLLQRNLVVIHPLIIGELACGNLQNRSELLRLWQSLESMPTLTDEETLFFIDKNQLMGKGVGYIDIQLLASIKLSKGVKLWTLDKRLAAIAGQMDLGWDEQIAEE